MQFCPRSCQEDNGRWFSWYRKHLPGIKKTFHWVLQTRWKEHTKIYIFYVSPMVSKDCYAHYLWLCSLFNSFFYGQKCFITRRLSKVLSSLLDSTTPKIFKWELLSFFFKGSIILMVVVTVKVGVKLSIRTLKSFVMPSCFCIKNQATKSLAVWITGKSGQRLWNVLQYKGTELTA